MFDLSLSAWLLCHRRYEDRIGLDIALPFKPLLPLVALEVKVNSSVQPVMEVLHLLRQVVRVILQYRQVAEQTVAVPYPCLAWTNLVVFQVRQ
jgi:hypothetical protein